MLSYPAFQVDGGPSVGAFRLPFEVDLTILVLGVLVGHLSPVNDVYCVAVTRVLPAGSP